MPASIDTVLLERDHILADLSAALGSAGGGAGRLVLLSGEAGVGKTSVIRQFAALLAEHRVRVLIGACEPLITPRALGPLLDVAGSMGTSVDYALGRTLAGAGVHELFDSLLADLAAHEATVLVFEDVHWADEATLDLLRFLARRVGRLPTLVVATYRDDELSRTHPLAAMLGDVAASAAVDHVALARLSRAAVAELCGGRRSEIDELFTVTGGNPFFVTEVLAAAGGTLPATVRAAVQGRLARLSETAAAAVEAVAVLGSPAEPDVVDSLVAQAGPGLAEAIDNGLLQSYGIYVGFRHELARLAVLDAMPTLRRAALHRDVLELLIQRDGELSQIVEHADQADDDSALLTYAPRAGARAAALGAHREAAAHYGRALGLAGSRPIAERLALLQAADLEYFLIGEMHQAVACRREIVQLFRESGDKLAEGDALQALAHDAWAAGFSREPRRLAVEAIRILEELPPGPELGRAYATMVQLCFFAHDVESVLQYEHLALALTERLDVSADLRLWVRYFSTAARLHATDDGWEELEEIRRQMVAQASPEYAMWLTVLSPCMAAYRHDPTRALPMLDDAMEFLLENDMLGFLLYLRGCRAHVLLQSGEWAAAEDELTALMADPRWSAVPGIAPQSVLSLLRARRGEPDVWPVLDEAMKQCEEPDLLRLGPLHEARAETAWLAGDDQRAIAEALRGLAGVGPMSDPWQAGPIACWIYRAGGVPPDVPAAEPYALEMAGDWAMAAVAYERRGLPYEAALARLDGDAAAVRDALVAFDSLGADVPAERARARLRELGERRGTRGPRAATRGNSHGLTQRQVEVFELLRAGLTNSEIADRLVLSQHTVSHHVSAVLAKLAMSSRTEVINAPSLRHAI